MNKIVLPANRAGVFSERDQYIFSTRVRFARNVDGLLFPARLAPHEKKKLEVSLKNVISNAFGSKLSFFDISKLEERFVQNMESDLLITDTFSQFGDIFFAENHGSWVLLPNEKDHLKLFSIEYGADIKRIYKKLESVLSTLESHIHFAFHPDFGYLTSYANNAGTGLSISCLFNLTGIEMTGRLDALVTACEETGYFLIPFTGMRGSQLFFLKNLSSFGVDEVTLITKFLSFTDKIIQQESLARKKLFENKNDTEFLIAQLMDALNTKSISYQSLVESVALADMLQEYGWLMSSPDDWRRLIFTLHPNSSIFNESLSRAETEEHRADFLKKSFKKNIKINK